MRGTACTFLPVSCNITSCEQALNLFVEWGVLGDETSWKQPVRSWFDLWWKKAVSSRKQAYTSIAPPQELLEEAAKAEQEYAPNTGRALEKPSLDLALSSAPAACGRASAVLPRKALDKEDGVPHSLDQKT